MQLLTMDWMTKSQILGSGRVFLLFAVISGIDRDLSILL
jgi:hypothetical protein